ncbi:NAD-dependent epimerase/dehydratase family protein [Zoogloea sp.]|uniref:NAD-dependent epimerase/dehydratase family protein n=1 Tax=Zoogloea sp. TaxID=49181 RepID=UPI0035AE37AB
MRCLVLGACGFIGRHLVDDLLENGHEVLAYDRAESLQLITPVHPQLKCIAGDFQRELRWGEILQGVKVCYHLISTSVPKSSNDDPISDVTGNVLGSLHLLEAARRHNVRIVFTSSGGTVYGNLKGDVVREDHPTDPLCSYGITKLAIEKYLQLYRELHGVNSVVLRIANPYGPGQRPDAIQGVIAVFSGRILRNHVLDLWGDGSVVRDYVFVKDVVAAMRAAAAYRGRYFVFNIGAGQGVSLREILVAIEELSGKKAEVIYHPPRGFDIPKSVLDISRANGELGWSPCVSLHEGLRQTLDWMKDYIASSPDA